MLFIEELMNLPKAWDLQQIILANNEEELAKINSVDNGRESSSGKVLRANVSKRDKLFQDYISELTADELDLLYTAYYYDFYIYGYDVCDGL